MTTRRDAIEPVIAAVYPLLNVGAFLAVATGGIHRTQAPQETATPYGVIQAPRADESLGVMQGGQTALGQEVRFWVKGVSAAPDDTEARAIAAAAMAILDGPKPAIANFEVLRIWWEWTTVYPDPELVNGVPVWNAVAQFCVLLDQVS